jgi:hypothetical protein
VSVQKEKSVAAALYEAYIAAPDPFDRKGLRGECANSYNRMNPYLTELREKNTDDFADDLENELALFYDEVNRDGFRHGFNYGLSMTCEALAWDKAMRAADYDDMAARFKEE